MNYRIVNTLSALFIILVLAVCKGPSVRPDLSTVTVDWTRYTGVWYSIGRFPHRFEKHLQQVTADYRLNKDGSIQVINAGYNKKGEREEARATAKIQKEPGVLKVYFIPFIGGEYRVLEIDPDYRFVLVGSSSADYLWILSRTPQLPEDTVNTLLKKAEKRGYDLRAFERVNQLKSEK
jgi:apolipoprotein D and lipocalin family protein